MSFYTLHVSFVEAYYALAETLDKLFLASLKMNLAIPVNRWGHLKCGQIFCVHRPKSLIVSTFQG